MGFKRDGLLWVFYFAACCISPAHSAFELFTTLPGAAEISVRDFGAIANDGVCDADAINQAVIEASAESPAILFFEAGTYNLSELEYRQALIRIDGISDLELRGATDAAGGPATRFERNVTTLKNDLDVAAQVGVYNSTNITIRNIISDNIPAFATGGIITAVERKSDMVEVEILPGLPHFEGMKCYSANSWNFETRELLPVPALTIGVDVGRFSNTWQKISEDHDRLYRIKGMEFSGLVEPGQGISWHFYVVGKGRQFELDRNVNTTLDNIRICNIKGLGVMATNCRDLTFSRVVVKSETPVPAVGARDAFHMICCGGKLLVDQCTIQGVRWDPFNIKSRFVEVIEIVDSRTIRCHTRVGERLLPIGGRKVVFWTGERPVEVAAAQAVWDAGEPGGEGRFDHAMFTLYLSEDLPDTVRAGALFTPQAWIFDSAEIRDTTIEGNYGRALLYQGENLSVVNSTFKNNAYANIALGPINHHEGGFVRNVRIEGCTFADSTWNNNEGLLNGTVTVYQNCRDVFRDEPYNEQIVLRNNVFRGAWHGEGVAAVCIANAQDVKMLGNRFADCEELVRVDDSSTRNVAAEIERRGR